MFVYQHENYFCELIDWIYVNNSQLSRQRPLNTLMNIAFETILERSEPFMHREYIKY